MGYKTEMVECFMVEQDKDRKVKEIILKNAVELFCRFGFVKTTMEDIAKAAGKGKSTLYHYYKNKDTIFDAVVDRELRGVLGDVKSAMRDESSAAQKLRTYFKTFVFSTNQKSAALISEILRNELSENSSIIDRAKKRINAEEIRFIKEILVTGAKTGEFIEISDKNVNHIAFALIMGVRTVSFDIIIETDSYNKWREPLEVMIELFIKGLSK